MNLIKITLLIIAGIIGMREGGMAQSIEREVVDVGGGYTTTDHISLSFSVGEVVVNTARNSKIILTQGFEQGRITLILGTDNLGEEIKIKAYPNPVIDIINLMLNKHYFSELTLKIYNPMGVMLMEQAVFDNHNQEQINMIPYPPGIYQLALFSSDEKLVESFKILKLK
jgi:hypothetical protein